MAKKEIKPEIEAEESPVITEPQRVFMVRKGFNFGPEDTRVEPGPLAVELPPDVMSDLIEAGAITLAEGEADGS